MKQNGVIYLIGFMGAGKSSVAGELCKITGFRQIELDAYIEEKQGMKIAELFERYGEEYFRNLEADALLSASEKKGAVISCGGGVILKDGNAERMKESGCVVYLTASPETVYSRVKDSTERPVLNQNMSTEYIRVLMENRREKYENAADITVTTDGKAIKDVCREIIAHCRI